MQIGLSDHNCEGQAEAIFDVLCFDGILLALVPMQLNWFRQVGLSEKVNDETVWRFCQEHSFLLLTGNRTANDKEKSLESVIRRLVRPNSLPVITIGNLKRVKTNPAYCKQCAERLAEIVYDLENFRGTMRIFIP